MKLYAHPRSGTNYALALIGAAFYGDTTTFLGKSGHWSQREMITVPTRVAMPGCPHAFYTDGLEGPRIYLYRDGRDVVLSMWRAKSFHAAQDRGLSFTEFLRHPLDWYETPGKPSDAGLTSTEHWKAQLDSWVGHEACYVRYEDLLADTGAELERIAHYTGRALLGVPQVEAVGPEPSGDHRAGKWRNAYTDDDLTLFHSIVPQDYWGLYAG